MLDAYPSIRHRLNVPDEIIAKLRAHGVRLADEEPAVAEEVPQPLEGLTFVITGTLPSMSREEATRLIEAHGGRVVGSVSKTTDYVLVGDKPGGTKFTRAQQLGVPMVEEATLRAMIAGEATDRGAADTDDDASGLPQQGRLI